MLNLKVLAVVLMVANAMAQQALGDTVQGFIVSPFARFLLAEFSTGVGVALLFLPRPSEASQSDVAHG